MCKITDEIIRIAKKNLRNNSREKIQSNHLKRIRKAEEIEDPVARSFAVSVAMSLKTELEKSYEISKKILDEYAKAKNGKINGKKNKTKQIVLQS